MSAKKHFWESPGFPTVIDPRDGKERPFCSSVGRLFAFSMHSKRYVVPTTAEDTIWCAAGQTQIERDNLCGPRLPVREKTFG